MIDADLKKRGIGGGSKNKNDSKTKIEDEKSKEDKHAGKVAKMECFNCGE
jgi:hypothetical protein